MAAPILLEPKLPKRAFAIIFGVSMATALGNTGLMSVLPVIGRTLEIPDYMISGIFSVSAVLWAFSSPFWARSSDRYGRKPLMMLGLSGFMVSMIVCGAIVTAGMHHMAAPMIIFGMLLAGRSIFGFFGASSNPATQAYVAEHSSREDRTKSMANLAGAFGLGTVIGPFVAPLFIVPHENVAGPLFGFAGIAAVMLGIVWRFLPESPFVAETRRQTLELEAKVAATGEKLKPMWLDRRLTPFLIYGFLVAVCQTVQGQILGFLIIDTMHLTPSQAQGFIAIAMMFGAVAGLLAQWGIIGFFEMGPRQLLRWGVGIAAIGMLMVAFASTYWMVVAGYAISSLGFGLARPGFTAGASLSVQMDEQARAAGAIAAVNGINVVLAPAFVKLYEQWAWAPFVVATVVLVALLVYAFVNPILKNIDESPATTDEIAGSTLERTDEAGV